MPLLILKNLHLAFGDKPLLDGVDFQLDAGERVCLLGRNGAGKSSMLKLIGGITQADDGDLWQQPGTTVAMLEQDLPEQEDISVFDYIAKDHAGIGSLLQDYHRESSLTAEPDLQRLATLQTQIEDRDGWALENRIEQVIKRLQLPADQTLANLSGGWRRRVSLARALSHQPDVLLLDEPTNHLDMETIEWMEQQLLDFNGAILFITHDRRLLRRLATRIAELDRGVLFSWDGDYDSFLRYREQTLETEQNQNRLFDQRLAEEEKWIRQGIKARRTRNEGRVRALKAMRQQRAERRVQQGRASFDIEAAEKSGKLVCEMLGVSKSYEDRAVITGLDFKLLRGDRVGLIGPNGAGKSTLLKLLLGDIDADSGNIRLGTKRAVAYFDQNRAQLNMNSSVFDSVSDGRDFIDINGKQRHVMSYLSDFLFSPERVRSPVSALSGGEKNRLLLAKMFSKPANILVLDEPTNDLDVETLELLEELLGQFDGTVLLVSHDREFLDNVVTSVLVFEGDARVVEYVGGYEDWLRQRPKTGMSSHRTAKPVEAKAVAESAPTQAPTKSKLSYKFQRELDQLPGQIEALEEEIAKLEEQVAAPEFYQGPREQIEQSLTLLADSQKQLEQAYERWEELDSMQS